MTLGHFKSWDTWVTALCLGVRLWAQSVALRGKPKPRVALPRGQEPLGLLGGKEVDSNGAAVWAISTRRAQRQDPRGRAGAQHQRRGHPIRRRQGTPLCRAPGRCPWLATLGISEGLALEVFPRAQRVLVNRYCCVFGFIVL